MKELPKVFRNNIPKKLDNNKKVFYSNRGEMEENVDVNQKIKDIFSSPNYVYKADVTIRLKDKVLSKTIVGKTTTSLMTIDNEFIPISDILDINKKTT